MRQSQQDRETHRKEEAASTDVFPLLSPHTDDSFPLVLRLAAYFLLLLELCAVVQQYHRVRIANCHLHIYLPVMVEISETHRNRYGAVRNCRDDIDMVILRVGVELNDFNCSGYINGDKMVRMLWTISMADKLVCLERA